VLQHTIEGPQHWLGYLRVEETSDHRRVLQAMAFTAFNADVEQTVRNIHDLRSLEDRDGEVSV